MPSHFRSKGGISWLILIVFAFLTFGIGVSEYVFYLHQQAAVKKAKAEELSAIADLKVNEINTWRSDRLADGWLIRDDPARCRLLGELLSNPTNRSLSQSTLGWMRLLRESNHYSAVLLVDTTLRVVLSSPEKGTPQGSKATSSFRRALTTETVVLSDFHRDDQLQMIYLDLIIPIITEHGLNRINRAVGAVILRVDPKRYFYQALQTWSATGKTNEVLLVRREGDQVIYLNELRHRNETALRLHFPAANEQLIAAIAVRGLEGSVEGIDYRSIPVMAATRKIPDSPWFLVAKIDMEEVEGPVREREWMIALVVGLLVLSAGSVAVSLVWNERANQLRKQYDSELERQALAEHFHYLTKYANDLILLTNTAGNIIEANDRALEVYGYSRREFAELSTRNLTARGVTPGFDELMEKVRKSDGILFETVHQRADGTTFDVEVSSRAITVSGVTFYQSIIRDITKRKEREKRSSGVNLLNAMLSDVRRGIIRVRDRRNLPEDVCTIAVEKGGFLVAWIGFVNPETGSLTIAVSKGMKDASVVSRHMAGDNGTETNSIAAEAIREGHSIFLNSIADSGDSTMWLRASRDFGIRSAACFPLWRSEKIYGALGLCSGVAGFFGGQEIKMLEDMVSDLGDSFGSM